MSYSAVLLGETHLLLLLGSNPAACEVGLCVDITVSLLKCWSCSMIWVSSDSHSTAPYSSSICCCLQVGNLQIHTVLQRADALDSCLQLQAGQGRNLAIRTPQLMTLPPAQLQQLVLDLSRLLGNKLEAARQLVLQEPKVKSSNTPLLTCETHSRLVAHPLHALWCHHVS